MAMEPIKGGRGTVTQNDHAAPPSNPRPVFLVYLFCLAFWLLAVGAFWSPLRQLLTLSLHDNLYSHLIVIPFISVCLMYWRRRDIFRATAYDLRLGIPLVLAAVASGWWLSTRFLSVRNDYGLSLVVLAVIFVTVAGFFLCYGVGGGPPPPPPPALLPLFFPVP